MTEQAAQETCAGMGATVEEHKKLEPFVGTFKAEVKMWMGSGDPTVSTGVMTSAFDLGGRFLKQVYKGDADTGPFANFEGRGYWGYNTVENKYEGFWIDTACTLMQTETGEVDASGKVWTMRGEMANPDGSGTMTKRSVITLIDNDRHSLEMFFGAPGADESKAMEIQYQRA